MADEKKSYILTDEEQKAVMQTLEESAKQNENLKVLADLPSNNGVEEHQPEQGTEKFVNVSIDPKTGEKTVLGEAVKTDPEDIGDVLERTGVKANNEDFNQNYQIKEEDLSKAIDDDTLIGKFSITPETSLELVNFLNDVKAGRKKISYNNLPEQIKGYVTDYCNKNGVASHSVQANTIRNNVAEMLISNLIDNIQMNSYMDDFNTELENIYKTTGEEISPLLKEYNESRIEMINKACANIEDEEKKVIVEKTLDAINDAYELKRFIEAAPYIKIKKFNFEKPEKVFKEFLYKYQNSKYNIYDLATVLQVLHRHLVQNKIIEETDVTSAIKVLLAFCIYCRNFKPENTEQHAFMYYFTYNIILLDMYKADQYEEFSKKFLANIKTVLDNLR